MTKRKMAEALYSLYMDAINSAFPKRVASKQPAKVECEKCGGYFFSHSTNKLCDRCRKRRVVSAHSFDELPESDQKHFIAAARICMELECEPRDFIVAQFAMWREASTYHKKLLWPMPMHISKLAAKVRYLQHNAREQIRLSRVDTNEDQDEGRRWYVEERRLNGLARMQRRDPLDVITEQPEQFSRDFLKHRGLWDVVQDLWESRHE